jgi:hypothetical protein
MSNNSSESIAPRALGRKSSRRLPEAREQAAVPVFAHAETAAGGGGYARYAAGRVVGRVANVALDVDEPA